MQSCRADGDGAVMRHTPTPPDPDAGPPAYRRLCHHAAARGYRVTLTTTAPRGRAMKAWHTPRVAGLAITSPAAPLTAPRTTQTAISGLGALDAGAARLLDAMGWDQHDGRGDE